jgi:3-methyl-2-oxobutanoate hydroxymethyltransferase
MMMTVPEFKKFKSENKKITMVTCYDASFAKVLCQSEIDVLLVGDSSAMVMHGFDSTIHANPDLIAAHVAAVARGCRQKGQESKFIVADMPFLSTRLGLEKAVEISGQFLKAGAHAIKIEGLKGNQEIIYHLVESGIPVMGHLGLTPQFVNAFGGMKVQAKTAEEQDVLFQEAMAFEKLGAFSLVLECIPSEIATKITSALSIPTIGIGAGAGCDGQVLVLQDLLGFNPDFKPKFLRRYSNGFEVFQAAFARFNQDVKSGNYPSKEESY